MTQFWRDPALPFVESRRSSRSRSRACYRAHSHSTLSIGVVDQGRSLFQWRGGQFILTPGNLISIPANIVHSCNPVPTFSWSYQMLHLSTKWLAEVVGDDVSLLSSNVFISTSPLAYRAYCQLNMVLFSCAPIEQKEAELIRFLTERFWCGDTTIPLPQPIHSRLKTIQTHIREDLEQPPGLEVLAHNHGMSRYQLIRLFRRETGLTPHAWLQDQRIQAARKRLQQSAELAGLAQELGFADQGHFQRAFKARVATTPGRYRRR